jgi:hypothetical protein
MSKLWDAVEQTFAESNDVEKLLVARWLCSDVQNRLEVDQDTQQRTALTIARNGVDLALAARDDDR